MADSEFDVTRLERYAAGECTPAEAAEIRRWLESDRQAAALFEAIQMAMPRRESPNWNARERWEQLTAIVPGLSTSDRAASERRLVIHRDSGERAGARALRTRAWRVAGLAVASVMLAVGGIAVSRAGWLSWLAPTQQFREFASARGARTTITLHDGTRFVLGPDTRLRVSSDFGVATRTVELDGEALFSVVHDERHPFAVRTSRTTVRDVGTTFAVRAYHDDSEQRVAVAEGEVAMGGDVSLRARDVATIGVAGAVTVRRGVDVAPFLLWTQGRLAFDGIPLRDVASELSRTFNLDVEVADSAMAGLRVTATFGDESVGDVLSAVAYLVGGHYERNGREVVIRRGVAPTGRSTPAAEVTSRFARAGR